MRMRTLLQNKVIQVFLGLLVLVIWIYNSVQILGIGSAEEIPAKINHNTQSVQPESSYTFTEQYHYKGNFRDPFRPALQRVPKTVVVQQPVYNDDQIEVYKPELLLTGVVENRAIIKDLFQGIYFAVPGDTIQEAVVISVTPDSVILDYKKSFFVIKLN